MSIGVGNPVLLGRRERSSLGAQTFGTAAFDPTTITGLDLWLRADTLAGADGTAIGTWSDESGNARHLTQATGADQPLKKTGIRNSLPVLRFDGTSDFMRNTSMPARVAQTMFFVMQKRSAVGVTGQGAWDRSAGEASLRAASGTVATNWHWRNNSGAEQVDTGITGNAWHIISVRVASASALTFRAEGGAATASFDPDDAVTTGTRLTLGHSGAFGDVDFAEVIWYASALSTTDHDAVGNYLATKWGFTWTAVS